MPKSSIFILMVIVLVGVGLTMVMAMGTNNQPTLPVYLNNSSTINQSQQFIAGTVMQTPNWVIPAILVAVAVVLITTALLVYGIGKGR